VHFVRYAGKNDRAGLSVCLSLYVSLTDTSEGLRLNLIPEVRGSFTFNWRSVS